MNKNHFDALSQALVSRVNGTGVDDAALMEEAAMPLLSWINHLYETELTGHCDEMIDGVRSLVLESVCGVTAGLLRMSILSLRGQVDLVFTWLYFKDHHIEWEKVIQKNEGFKLKKDVFDYLVEFYPSFKERFDILKSAKKRSHADPYKILSAHIHSTGMSAVPTLTSLADFVSDDNLAKDCIAMQEEVSEYLSDILVACFGSKWVAFPIAVSQDVKDRVAAGKLSAIFS
jgi:hypothetical protein